MKIFFSTKIRMFFALPFIVAFFSGLVSLNAQNIVSQNSQDYKIFYYEVYQADRLANQGNYSEALLRYEAASQKVNFVQTSYLKKFLKAAKKAENKPLQKKYESLIERQKKTPAEYAHLGPKLDSLYAADQGVRKKQQRLINYYWKNIDNKSVRNSSKFLKGKKAQEEWSRTDSLNQQILLSMFEAHGFLDESKIGYERYRSIFILLLHFDTDTNNSLLQPIFDKALAKGQINPYTYALILDRHLNSNNLPQNYYAWPDLRSDPKLSEEEIKQINNLREDIGMYHDEIIIEETRGDWRVTYKSKY